jgi:hypothetical protein
MAVSLKRQHKSVQRYREFLRKLMDAIMLQKTLYVWLDGHERVCGVMAHSTWIWQVSGAKKPYNNGTPQPPEKVRELVRFHYRWIGIPAEVLDQAEVFK